MKKRVLAVILGAVMLFSTFNYDMVLQAEDQEQSTAQTVESSSTESIESTETSEETTVAVSSNTLSITNSIIKKTGTGNSDTGEAEYTVYINQARNTLSEGTYVEDILGSSFALDALSVVLYVCKIDDDGNITSKSEVNSTEYIVTVSASGDKTVLDVTTPATNDVYLLSYTA